MLADEQRTTPAHPFEIERPRFLVCITSPERRYHWTMNFTVNVGLAERGIARMKIIGRVFREDDAHVAAQISVDCIPKFPRSDRALKVHICDLTFCVHPGIGAPRSMNNDFSIIE